MTKPLTPRQARFVQEYLIDLNATQAAIRAGYSRKTAHAQGSRVLQNVEIRNAVAKAQADRSRRTAITQDYVLAKLQENLDRAMQAEPVRDRDGNETGEFVYEGAVANGALRMLGDHLGMFKQKHEHTGPDGQPLIPPAINIVLVRPRDGAG